MFLRKYKMPDIATNATRPAPFRTTSGFKGVLWYQRLYLRIFLAMLAGLAIAALLFAIAVHAASDSESVKDSLGLLNDFVAEALPAHGKSVTEQHATLLRWHQRMKVNLSLYDADGQLVTSVGDAVLPLSDDARRSTVNIDRQGMSLKLTDGRYLVARNIRSPHRSTFSLGWSLLIITLSIALVAYPVVRRLTRRLERLQRTVDSFGSGQLASRIAVEGADEIASLGASFNQAAERIETLVAAQKNLLANASHELRSPLARIRMALELLDIKDNDAIGDELKQNIHELDQLIDEILLSARLDAASGPLLDTGSLDVAALLAEECARLPASLDLSAATRPGAPVPTLEGDAKLLRRLVRNLLENAARYGNGSAVEVSLRLCSEIGSQALALDVCDRGPGIPQAQREAIFDAFYRLPGASERAGGVGLGLSLVRSIAQQHGGAVSCLAREGGGSCFRVVLPLRQGAGQQAGG
jgi:signal transduction histidine kinase